MILAYQIHSDSILFLEIKSDAIELSMNLSYKYFELHI